MHAFLFLQSLNHVVERNVRIDMGVCLYYVELLTSIVTAGIYYTASSDTSFFLLFYLLLVQDRFLIILNKFSNFAVVIASRFRNEHLRVLKHAHAGRQWSLWSLIDRVHLNQLLQFTFLFHLNKLFFILLLEDLSLDLRYNGHCAQRKKRLRAKEARKIQKGATINDFPSSGSSKHPEYRKSFSLLLCHYARF